MTVSAGRAGRGRAQASVADWEQGLQVLQAHVAAQGSAAPPTHLVVDGVAVGRWVARRREQFRAGVLPADRVAVLQAMPGWSWGRTQGDRFEEGLTHLQAYVSLHGTADVARDDAINGFPLGRWVARRRQSHVVGELRLEWAQVLEALPGWQWRQQRQPGGWADGVGALGAWVSEHGSAVIPPGAHLPGVPVGGVGAVGAPDARAGKSGRRPDRRG